MNHQNAVVIKALVLLYEQECETSDRRGMDHLFLLNLIAHSPQAKDFLTHLRTINPKDSENQDCLIDAIEFITEVEERETP